MEGDMQRQTRRGYQLLIGVALAFSVSLWTGGASAHHGWGGYEGATTAIPGWVETPVCLAGPHATMKSRADGKIWDVVLAPGPRSSEAGLKDGMIPVGEKVTVHGNRHRDPKKFEIKTSRVTWKNQVFNVYPDRS